MDLDEMKAVWSDLSDQLDKQKKLNQDIILKMTQEKSSSRLGRIIRMETIGIIASIAMLIYLVWNFNRLEDWLSIVGGIGLLCIIILGIVYGTTIIRKAKSINVMTSSYSEVIENFDQFRALLRKYKKLSVRISIVSPVLVIPVSYTLLSNKNILDDLESAGLSLILSAIFVPLILYAIIRFYSRNVSQVKKALKDIDFKD